MKDLPPRVALRPLGHADEGHAIHAHVPQFVQHHVELPAPAVDKHQIGPGGKAPFGHILLQRPARLFLGQPREAPPHDLAHHAEVIPRRDVFALDVELAVMGLHEALRPGHDHRADGIGALNVGVVIDLDAPWRARQLEGFRHARQQLRLGARRRQPPSQRLAGVLQRRFHELPLLAALRAMHRNLAPGARRKRFGQQTGLLHLVRQQHQRRRGPVVIELRHEGGQDFRLAAPGVDAREIGLIAPVLKGAEEEGLNARLPALHRQGEDVRLLEGARIDPLPRADVRHRRDAVAQHGGGFVIQPLRRLLHLPRQFRLHPVRAPGEKILGLLHQRVVFGDAHLARAGRGAAADLVQKAGPGAVGVNRIGAAADEKGLLHGADRPVHRPGVGEGAVVGALHPPRPAMLGQPRRLVIPGDEDVGKRLVVAQQHVVARLELLDQVGFQQQRLGLGGGDGGLHARHLHQHQGDAVGVPLPARVGAHPRLQIARLAHVEQLAGGVMHAVNARLARQRLHEGGDHLHPRAQFSAAVCLNRHANGCMPPARARQGPSPLLAPLDLHADGARFGEDVGLFHPHAGGQHIGVLEALGGDHVGQRLHQMHMAIGNDLPDVIHHLFIGDHLVDIVLQRIVALAHRQIDVDDDPLRLQLLEVMHPQHGLQRQVAHEDMRHPAPGAGDGPAHHRGGGIFPVHDDNPLNGTLRSTLRRPAHESSKTAKGAPARPRPIRSRP